MGIYIHVPFCGTICSYCDFARTARHDADLRRDYVAGVIAELDLRRGRCEVLASGQRRLETCYLGGGTPSQLEPELMVRLLEGTVGRWPLAEDFELTVEANPETLTADLARTWRDSGVSRVSVGVQSLQLRVLDLLGRTCDPQTARAGLATACRVFPRVSADWILGPGVTRGHLLAELDEAVALGVEHFSLYVLEIHAGTRLAGRVAAGEVAPAGDRATEELYLAAASRLADHGVVQYEVANFARPGQESRHNGNYWRGRPWLGLGPGAHGCWGRWRYANHRSIEAWLADIRRGVLPVAGVDTRDRAARRLERLILALRTRAGVPLGWIPSGALDLKRGRDEGLWELTGERLRLTTKGFLRIDTIEERLARA